MFRVFSFKTSITCKFKSPLAIYSYEAIIINEPNYSNQIKPVFLSTKQATL